MPGNVPFLANDEICRRAVEFLDTYNSSGEIPVPIEEIIEFDLGVEIRPVRGFYDRFNIEGYLSNDLTTIYVDDERMTRNLNRYRFTLAHEVGHLILHPDYIRAFYPTNPEAWKAAICSVPAPTYGRLEYQAYQFAGGILVPPQPLLASWQEACDRASDRGIDLAEMGESGVDLMAGWIAKQFKVSTEVILRCLKRDSLTPLE